jgi:hypothetical protein
MALTRNCWRKFEMSPAAQSRDDTPRQRTHLLRNAMSAKRWVWARGSGAKAGLPVRGFAQPLRRSLAPSTMKQPSVCRSQAAGAVG